MAGKKKAHAAARRRDKSRSAGATPKHFLRQGSSEVAAPLSAWALARRRADEAAQLLSEQGALLEELLTEWEVEPWSSMDCGEFVSPLARNWPHARWPEDPRSLFPEPDNHAVLRMARRLQARAGRLFDLGAVELALRTLQEDRLARARGIPLETLRAAKAAAVARWTAHKRKAPFTRLRENRNA
ncbi:MAG: hypothetical protein QM778_15800 [Myxococcales bacterium]